MSPDARGLDSHVNWNKESQRNFWNASDIKHLQTVSQETLRRGNEALTIISSLNLQRPRILEIGCGNGWLAERLLSFGPVTGVWTSRMRQFKRRAAEFPPVSFTAATFWR